MPDRDILLSKADAIRRALRRIRNVTGLKPESLDNIDAQDIFVLNLQRAVQSAIDSGWSYCSFGKPWFAGHDQRSFPLAGSGENHRWKPFAENAGNGRV